MDSLDPEPGTIHLRLSRPMDVDLDLARRRIEAADWLGFEVGTEDAPLSATRTPAGSPPVGPRRFETDLGLAIRPGSQRTVFRKAALVDLGLPEATERGLRVPIAWRSATLAPLFPVFAGRIDIFPDELVIDGWYAPPGGAAGVVVDRAFLNLAARGTARWFLDRIGAAIESSRHMPPPTTVDGGDRATDEAQPAR